MPLPGAIAATGDFQGEDDLDSPFACIIPQLKISNRAKNLA